MTTGTLQPIITADQLIASARSLQGVPFRHQGRTRFGVDCIGFVLLACEEAGLDLHKVIKHIPTRYGRSPDVPSVEILSKHCARVYKPVPGCVLVFRFHTENIPRHFGIFTGDAVIHADGTSRKQVIAHGYRAQWLKYTHSMWLIPGVDYSDVQLAHE